MTLDLVAIAVATIAQFIVGALWYTVLFGTLWARIHGFDTLSPEVQKEAQKQMLPLLFVQFALTVITSVMFAVLQSGLLSGWNTYVLAVSIWFGFIMPAQVSAVLFGGTAGKWVVKKILVSIGASLLCLCIAAFVFQVL